MNVNMICGLRLLSPCELVTARGGGGGEQLIMKSHLCVTEFIAGLFKTLPGSLNALEVRKEMLTSTDWVIYSCPESRRNVGQTFLQIYYTGEHNRDHRRPVLSYKFCSHEVGDYVSFKELGNKERETLITFPHAGEHENGAINNCLENLKIEGKQLNALAKPTNIPAYICVDSQIKYLIQYEQRRLFSDCVKHYYDKRLVISLLKKEGGHPQRDYVLTQKNPILEKGLVLVAESKQKHEKCFFYQRNGNVSPMYVKQKWHTCPDGSEEIKEVRITYFANAGNDVSRLSFLYTNWEEQIKRGDVAALAHISKDWAPKGKPTNLLLKEANMYAGSAVCFKTMFLTRKYMTDFKLDMNRAYQASFDLYGRPSPFTYAIDEAPFDLPVRSSPWIYHQEVGPKHPGLERPSIEFRNYTSKASKLYYPPSSSSWAKIVIEPWEEGLQTTVLRFPNHGCRNLESALHRIDERIATNQRNEYILERESVREKQGHRLINSHEKFDDIFNKYLNMIKIAVENRAGNLRQLTVYLKPEGKGLPDDPILSIHSADEIDASPVSYKFYQSQADGSSKLVIIQRDQSTTIINYKAGIPREENQKKLSQFQSELASILPIHSNTESNAFIIRGEACEKEAKRMQDKLEELNNRQELFFILNEGEQPGKSHSDVTS